MDLPYFDTVRGVPLDAMHNIYLGTCKAVMFALIEPQPNRSPRPDDGAAAAVSAAQPLLPAVLSKDDLIVLQGYMDACEVPRDVGHIPNKVARNMANFKAAEWANWISIFAFPHLTELRGRYIEQEKEPRVTEGHLHLFACLRTVAIEMRAYTVTALRVRDLERLLLKVTVQLEILFGADFIKPNQHYSLHLGPMLMDLGPTAGWSCNPYERFNGLLGNVPMNTAFAETCIMRRALNLISVSQRVSCSLAHARSPGVKIPDGCAQVDHFRMIRVVLSGDDVEVLVDDAAVTVLQRRTAAGAKQVRSAWNSQDEFIKYRTAQDVMGSESFPGCMRGTPEVITLYDASLQDFRPHSDWLLNAIITHYSKAYSDQLVAWRIDHPESDADTEPGRLRALGVAAPVGAYKPKNVNDMIQVYNTLDLGGQVFGSLRGRNPKAARVFMLWEHERGRWKPHFAHVNFFFVHDFAVPSLSDGVWQHKMTPHFFASVRYFEPHPEPHSRPGRSPDDLAPELAKARAEYPYLKKTIGEANHVTNLMCVQTIAGRWIACTRDARMLPGAGRVRDPSIQALPIPFSSRQHM